MMNRIKRWWRGADGAKIVKVGGRKIVIASQEPERHPVIQFWLRNWQWILTFIVTAIAAVAAILST